MALGIGTSRRQIPLVWQSMIYPFKTSVPTFGFCMSLYRTSDVLLHPFDLFLHWYYWRHKIDTFFSNRLDLKQWTSHIFLYLLFFNVWALSYHLTLSSLVSEHGISLICYYWKRGLLSCTERMVNRENKDKTDSPKLLQLPCLFNLDWYLYNHVVLSR